MCVRGSSSGYGIEGDLEGNFVRGDMTMIRCDFGRNQHVVMIIIAQYVCDIDQIIFIRHRRRRRRSTITTILSNPQAVIIVLW